MPPTAAIIIPMRGAWPCPAAESNPASSSARPTWTVSNPSRNRRTKRISSPRFFPRWASILTPNTTFPTCRPSIVSKTRPRRSAKSWHDAKESESSAVKVEQTKTFKMPTAVLGLDVSADAQQLYASCMDGGVYQVDAKSGDYKLLATHESFASGVSLVPGTSTLISAGYDGMLQWYDLTAGKTLRKVAAHKFWSWQSAVSPDGTMFASVTGQYMAGSIKYDPAPETEPSVKVFDAKTGKTLHELPHVPSVQAVAFSPDNKYVAAGNLVGEIRVWELATGKQLAQWSTPAFSSWGIIKSHCYQGGVYALAFSPDSENLIACGMGPMRDPMSANGKQTWQRFAWRKAGAPKIAEIHDRS